MRPEGPAAHGERMLELVYPEGLQHMRRTRSGAGEKHEKEGAADYGLATAPIHHSFSTAHQREIKEWAMKE